MKKDDLRNMTNGWFIGNFIPSLLKTENFEVAIKRYRAGAVEDEHYHKVATEFTCVVEGTVSFNDITYSKNDIITVYPNELITFRSITDSVTCVVKVPSLAGDKYNN
jgi:mannose-6-phosphate isomerase-like protein (cupin superfamily)